MRILMGLTLAFAAAASHAQSQTFGFTALPACGNALECQIGEAQIRMTVSQSAAEAVANQVRFTFTNSGPSASSIADVYFDDGTLLGISSIHNSAGVSFSPGASPGNLPGGNTIGFATTAGFSADSDPPVQPNGVNPGERLDIVFRLQPGVSFAQTLQAMYSGVDLRAGVHVQGFQSGGSQSFVNAVMPVPEPSAVALALAGLAVLGVAARRRRHN